MPTLPVLCWPPVMIELLMPMTRPSRSARAPPELPELMGASVWMAGMAPPGVSVVRPRALMMPAVTLWSSPKGLPMAMAICPTWRSTPVASVATVRSSTPSILTTATSVASSAPSTSPSTRRPSEAGRATDRWPVDDVGGGHDQPRLVVDEPGAEALLRLDLDHRGRQRFGDRRRRFGGVGLDRPGDRGDGLGVGGRRARRRRPTSRRRSVEPRRGPRRRRRRSTSVATTSAAPPRRREDPRRGVR